MNRNRKRREAEAREKRRRELALKDAVLVDRSAFDHDGFWWSPDFLKRGYYLDVEFICASCGSEEVWKAAQQKWWYEVARGNLNSGAKLCLTCRRDAREHKGKADPLQRPQVWVRRVREELEPAMLADGWRIVGGGGVPPDFTLLYERAGTTVRFEWGSGRFQMERRETPEGEFLVRFRTEGGCWLSDATPGELQRRLASFLAAVRDDLRLN